MLTGAHAAISDGGDLRRSFVWSFLDGWEFFDGLGSRYGLVHFKTQRRIVKSSGKWHGKTIRANGFNPPASGALTARKRALNAPGRTGLARKTRQG